MTHNISSSPLVKQLLKIRGGMRELSELAVAGCWWPCFPVLVILVSSSWTTNIFPVGRFQYFDQGNKSCKSSALIFADPQCFLHPAWTTADWPSPFPASGCLPGARGRRTVKTYNSQARNIPLVHTATSAGWSQPWIKDCRENNYLVPCLGLFNLQFSSTPLLLWCGSLAASSLGIDPGTVFAAWGTDCL